MKTKLLLASFFSFVFMASANAITIRELILKTKPDRTPTMNEVPVPDVNVIGNAVVVDFAEETKDVFILVTDDETGQVLHQEVLSVDKNTTLYIDLDTSLSTKYNVDVETDFDSVYSQFSL
ncbi:DUF3244 domain-containing protein [Bacteroides sp. 224]|uniref:DUF3244 domain-containing protein n=1 Tax=Bacteroides sp. 224 TaxID=2302936 RepID=UPI0013CFDE35|nr:DUF3244 domain-containing protein [Bacteroides sp. 224]